MCVNLLYSDYIEYGMQDLGDQTVLRSFVYFVAATNNFVPILFICLPF
jgi:hypothetical protein